MTRKEARDYILRQESTFLQPKYWLQIIVMVIGFVFIILSKGNGVQKSFIGVEKCDPIYWSLKGILITFGLCMTVVSVLIQKHEYELK